MWRTLVTIVVVTLTGLVGPDAAMACSCLSSGTPCDAGARGGAIFVGTVRARTDTPPIREPRAGATRGLIGSSTYDYSVSIDRVVQGVDAAVGSNVTVRSDNATSACGFPFRVGESYLVYASPDGAIYQTSVCSRTRRLADARDDLILLEQAKKGTVVSRTFGSAYEVQLQLKGGYSHYSRIGPVVGMKVVAHAGRVTRETTTDAGGRFAFEGLSPGFYEILPAWPVPLKPRFGNPTVFVGSCGAADINLSAFRDAPLSGSVRLPDGSLAGQDVIVTVVDADPANLAAPPMLQRHAVELTDATGHWSFDGLRAGRYLVGVNLRRSPSISSPYVERFAMDGSIGAATIVEVLEDRPTKLDLTSGPALAQRTVSGIVVDTNGTPVAEASVSLTDVEYPLEFVFGTHGQSDSAGRFTVKALEGRRYRVSAMSETRDGVTVVDKERGDVSQVWVVLKPARRKR